MNSNLEARFGHALNSVALELDGEIDRAATRRVVTQVVRRRRRVRAGLTSLAVGILIPLIAVATYAMMDGESTLPSVPSSPSPSFSAEPSPPTQQPSPSPSESETPPPARWEDIPDDDRPPFLEGQDPREPHSREMQEWVWDYVNDEWDLYVLSARSEIVSGITDPDEIYDFQTLFLEAPDGDTFRLFTLRTDQFALSVENWDQNPPTAWLRNQGFGDVYWVVEMDLRTGDMTDDWLDSVTPFAMSDRDDFVRWAAFIGTQQGGKEVWAFSNYSTPNLVFFRTPDGAFTPSAVETELRRRWDEGFADWWGHTGNETWISTDSESAVYLLQILDYTSEGPVAIERLWISHDLVTDEWQYFSAPLPTDNRCDASAGRDNFVNGENIVVHCWEGGTFTVDPSGEQAPSRHVD